MVRRSGPRRWLLTFLVLASGTLFQTSCTAAIADGTTGLASSVASQFIRNVIYDAFGVSSLSSLST